MVTGEPALQGKLRTHVTAWLGQHGFTVSPKPLSSDAQKTLINCFLIEDMACARGVFDHQATVDYLVFVRADLVGGKKSKEANLVAYWFLKDRDAVADKRNCKPCANKVLAKTAAEVLAAVYDETALAKAHLKISEPPGLVVLLDGTNVGVTPVEQDVAPGQHEISLQRDDQVLGSTTIETKAGDQTDVKVPITTPVVVATRPGEPDRATAAEAPPEHRPSRIVPGLMIALGAGAAITGGVFIYYGHKNGPDDPLIYPDANKQGAIIAGVGGAVLITGLVYWWVQGSSAEPPQNGPTASVVPGGTIVGWAGQF